MRFGTNVAFVGLATLISLASTQPAAGQPTRAPEASAQATRFAPETIGASDCFCHTFTPDGRTVVFVRSKKGFFEAHLEGGRWGEARPLPFSGMPDVRDGDPFFSPDGSTLYFWSSRGGKTSMNTDLHAVERRADGWGVPRNLGPPVNNEVNEPFPAAAADGTLYFGSARPGSGSIDIYRARRSGDGYAEPENLGPAVNSPDLDLDGYISPDQTTLVFGSNRPGGFGKIDLYVSHWRDGRWSQARNLGPAVNGPGDEFCPQLLEGGRLLLFSRGAPDAGAFQIDASVLAADGR